MEINRFNSSLLHEINTYYKGPFYQKVSKAFSVPDWEVDLGKACGSLFKTRDENIEVPTRQMVATYGRGSIGNDYVVTLYADHHLGKVIELLRQEEMNIEEIQRHLGALGFLKGITIEWPRDLFFRKVLAEGFTSFTNTILLETKEPFIWSEHLEIKDTEDLSFVGIMALLQVFLKGIESKRGEILSPSRIFKIFPYNEGSDPWLIRQNFFPIYQASQMKGFQRDIFFNEFKRFNDRYIAEAKQDLPLSLSNLLSESSFLWDKELFGIDPLQLEAMSEKERVAFLLKKKNAIIEQCFDYLAERMPTGTYLTDAVRVLRMGELSQQGMKDIKLRALRVSQQIEALLREMNSIETDLANTTLNRDEAKGALVESLGRLSEEELTAAQMEGELLKFIEGTGIPPELQKTPMGEFIKRLGDQYRKQTVLQAKYKDQLTEKGELLKPLKQNLSKIYAFVANDYLKFNTGNQDNINALLEVHTVFSYFIFNQDLFPEVSFSKLTKQGLREKGAARTILNFFRSSKRKRQENQALQGTIQSFLDETSHQMFQRFGDFSKGKMRALTPGEIKQIVNVSRDISQNPQSLGKFQKLEKVLKNILIEDEAFAKNCKDLAGAISTDQIIKLQTYMHASLLFAEGNFATTATGMTKAAGFKKLTQDTQRAIGIHDIETRAFQSETILEEMEKFNYPPQVTKSFTQNIQTAYRNVPPDQIHQLDLKDTPVNLNAFPGIQQKKSLLEEMKKRIIEESPKGDKESYFSDREMATRRPSQEETFRALPAIEMIFAKSPQIKKYLKDHYRGQLFTYEQLIDAVRSFAVREEALPGLFSSTQSLFNFFNSYDKDFHLATTIALYENVYREYQTQLKNFENLSVTQLNKKDSPTPEPERANVFEGTTFYQKYNEQAGQFANNYPLAQGLYEQFLPLFLTSYLADVNNLSFGRVFLSEAKLEGIKDVFPEAERVYGELNGFLTSQSRVFTELQDFFKAQENESGFLEEGFLNQLRDWIRKNISNPFSGIEDFTFASTIATLGLLLYTKSATFSVLGGLTIAYFWRTGIKPFLKDMYNLFLEGGKALFGYNSAAGINDYILNLFEVSFQTEVTLAQSQNLPGRKLELNDLFLNSLFLQEELSILRNSTLSLVEFRTRLTALVPDVRKNANMSVMILNMFFKLNEPGFLSVPNDLLKNAGSPLFIPALRDYLTAYENLIQQEKKKFLDRGHLEEECTLKIGVESPFRVHLTEKAKKGELVLTFPINSLISQFLGQQYLYLENPLLAPIQPTQINQGLPSFARNIQAFLETRERILAKEERLLGAIRPVMLRAKGVMTPSPQYFRNGEDMLKSNYMILRYTLNLARKMDNYYYSGTINTGDRWLSSTNEQGRALFLSPLYRETASNLLKTAQLLSLSGIKEGNTFLNIMRELEARVNTYLQGGPFMIPSQERVMQLEDAIIDAISNLHKEPQVAFAILYEKEKNPMSEIPLFIWRLLKEKLAEEMGTPQATTTIQRANHSNITYLVNGGIELFFTSPGLTGASLSPMVLNALEEAFKHRMDRGMSVFLGALSQQEQARLRSMQAIPKIIDVDALQRSSYQAMSRQRGQPLMLMPPTPQGTTTTTQQTMPLIQQQPSPSLTQQQQPQQQNAPFQNAEMPTAPSYTQAQGAPMMQGQQNIQQQGGGQMQGAGGSQTPVGMAQGATQPAQQETSGGSNFMPLLMPYGQTPQQGASEGPIQQQEQVAQPQIQEQRASQATPRNYVTVNADGSTGGTTSATGGEADPWAWTDAAIARADARIAEERRNPPPEDLPGPPPSRPYQGPMNMDDYWNYQEEANTAAQQEGFPYGKAAAVAGGLAALLAQMMKKDKKEEEK